MLEALSRVGGLKRRRGYIRKKHCGGNPAILLVAGSFIFSEPQPQSCSLLLAFQQKYSQSVTKARIVEQRIGLRTLTALIITRQCEQGGQPSCKLIHS